VKTFVLTESSVGVEVFHQFVKNHTFPRFICR